MFFCISRVRRCKGLCTDEFIKCFSLWFWIVVFFIIIRFLLAIWTFSSETIVGLYVLCLAIESQYKLEIKLTNFPRLVKFIIRCPFICILSGQFSSYKFQNRETTNPVNYNPVKVVYARNYIDIGTIHMWQGWGFLIYTHFLTWMN